MTTTAELAGAIDHTLLRPEATRAEALAVAAEAAELGCASVCLSPVHVPAVVAAGLGVPVCTVIGFPSGAHATAAKAAEASLAVDAGADELDLVIPLGAAKAGDWAAVTADIAVVRAVAPRPLVVKVIIESAVLTDDEIVAACRSAVDAGADYVKTSTGFHPAGGAGEAAVRLMAAAVAPGLGVKASGGIRTTEQALAMLAAGATRLGCSATRAILDGLPA